MSAVWKARDLVSGKLVALKVLHPHIALNPTLRDRFLHEVHAYERLRHPNVIACLRGGSSGDQYYVALELLTAGDLRSLLRAAGRIPPELAAWVLSEILGGLGHAHAAGVYHRDVKPENVLLAADGTPKLADFGISTTANADVAKLTVAGQLLGTPAYMAPERLRDGTVDARSDLWSAGVLLYEMVVGEAPFAGDTIEATVLRIRTETPPPLGYRVSEVPEELELLAADLLARDPGERVATAEEARDRLQPLLLRSPRWASRESMLAMLGDPTGRWGVWRRERSDGRLQRARTLLRREQPLRAAALLETREALAIDPDSAEGQALRGALEKGDPSPPASRERLRALEREAQENPNNVQALVNLVRVARGDGDDLRAVRAYRWGRRRSNNDRFAFAQLASALGFELAAYLESTTAEVLRKRLQGGRGGSADRDARAKAGVAAYLWGALLVLAMLVLWTQFPRAVEAPFWPSPARPSPPAVMAMVKEPDPALVVLDKAWFAFGSGDLERSLAILDHFLATWPDHALAAEASVRSGMVLEALSRVDEAIGRYLAVIDRAGGSDVAPIARRRLARLFAGRGDLEAALAVLDPLTLAGEPEDGVTVALERADLLLADGRSDEALAIYDEVLAGSAPSYLKARARLGRGHVLFLRDDPSAVFELSAAAREAGAGSVVAREVEAIMKRVAVPVP